MLSGAVFIILCAVALGLSIFWVFILLDILRSDFKDPSTKLIWFLFVLFSHFIGSVAYLIFGRSTKIIKS